MSAAVCERCISIGAIGPEYAGSGFCLCAAGIAMAKAKAAHWLHPKAPCGALYPDDDGGSVGGPCARASGHDGKHQDDHGGSWAQERTATAPPCGDICSPSVSPCVLPRDHDGAHDNDLWMWTRAEAAS